MSVSLPSLPSFAEFPRRIVCLTDETTEILYLLGEQDRIVGVSGFAHRPSEARSKPKVSAFQDANFKAILDLQPDLILGFSDVQAEITRELVLRGATVMNFNQRSISQILEVIAVLSRMVGKPEAGLALIETLRRGLAEIEVSANAFPRRPRVFFEEWNEPLISGIQWVEELIEIAGGEVLFPELRRCGKAKDRVVDPAAVAARDPEVILASWCGKKVNKEEICSRPAWAATSAVRNGHIYEVPSGLILQPGPASLTEGVKQLHAILARVVGAEIAPTLEQAKA
ncbi:MAG TPA: cobalamin-binding protein [Terracidiphilus sp.]|jgi:iron complex transport system substrate-binding protein